MSTTKKVEAGSMLAVAALVLVLITVGLPRISAPDRANDAWSERLTKQAAHLQEEARAARAAHAWSQRLSGLAAKAVGMSDRAIDAWADRLTGLAGFERGAVGMSDRAIDAWADRLTGLAEYYAVPK